MATAANPVQSLTAALNLDLPHIEAGVPLSAIADFAAKSGVPMKDIYAIVIPARTLKHRRARKQNLTLDESDKLARLVRVFDHAVKVFESPERAMRWLNSPKHRFDERTPLQMLNTEIGANSVENFLGQIDYGMFA
jgi:putative toxin-antitoxin system antitoxin component (TIGR02293 family)